MQLQIDPDQAEVLDEILRSAQEALRRDRDRTDAHAYRDKLKEREQIVTALLARLAAAKP